MIVVLCFGCCSCSITSLYYFFYFYLVVMLSFDKIKVQMASCNAMQFLKISLTICFFYLISSFLVFINQTEFSGRLLEK
jgi:hypothetical protein